MARQQIVYFIQCHRSATQTRQLFTALYSPGDIFLIHADLKCPPDLSDFAVSLTNSYSNVYLLDKELISWGGYSQARLLLRAIEYTLRLYTDWSHIVILSEQHLPLCSPDKIASALAAGESLIKFQKVSEMYPGGRSDVLHRFGMNYRELPGVGSFVDGTSTSSQQFIAELYHGSNWFILAKDACERLDSLRMHPSLLKPFECSLQADETLVSSVLIGTPLGQGLNIQNRNATFVAYPHLSGTPDLTFTESNFFSAIADNFLFIRKQPTIIPDRVAQFLAAENRVTIVDLSAALVDCGSRSTIRTNSEPSNTEDLIKRVIFETLRDSLEFTINFVDSKSILNVPKVCVFLRHTQWPPDLFICVLSEDLRCFKVLLGLKGHLSHNLAPAMVGNYLTSVIKARVHGIAFAREVFIKDDPTHGFVTINSEVDFGKVRELICNYISYAREFSDVFQKELRPCAADIAKSN